MMKKWSIALLVAAGAAGLTGCEGLRVEEGSSTSNSSGIVADRTVLGKLSGLAVDEYGKGLSDVTVTAYGMSTKTNSDGTWVMNDVPITNLAISNVTEVGGLDNAGGAATDDITSDIDTAATADGKIYVTFSKSDYATFNATYEGAIAVISHSGNNDGPNSIVVDQIAARIPMAPMAKLDRTLVGTVYDLGESTYSYKQTAPSSVQLRLVPSYLDDDLYGFDSNAADETESGEFAPGYYGLNPVNVTLTNGAFTIEGAGALRSGYELRVDGTNYRPGAYPEWATGVNQELIPVFDSTNTQIPNAVGNTGGGGDPQLSAYWKIDHYMIATGTNSLTTDLGELYVVNFNDDGNDVAVEIISYTGGPTNDLSTNGVHNNGIVSIDSDVVTIGGSGGNDIIVVFDEDIRSIDPVPTNAVKLINDSLVAVDLTASMSGRTLTITPTAALEKGTYRLILKRHIFIGKDGSQLDDADPANGVGAIDIDVDAADAPYDAVFQIDYGTSEYGIVAAENLQQEDDGALSALNPNILIQNATNANTSEQTRVERLHDSIRFALANDPTASNLEYTADASVPAANTSAVDVNKTSITFDALKAGNYKLTLTDGQGTELAGAATFTNAGTNIVDGGTAVTVTVGQTSADSSFNVSSAGAVTIALDSVGVGYTVAVDPLGDLTTSDTSPAPITLADKFAPRAAIQFSSGNDQDDAVAVFNLESSSEAGEVAFDGKTTLVYPKLNLTASLYDRSGYRGRSEDLGATGVNDGDDNTGASVALSDALVTQAGATPLLATTAATTAGAGTTASGRSDRYYVASDYTAWSQSGSGSSTGIDCDYYYADTVGTTGWVPADYDAATGAVTPDGGRATIVDADVTDWAENAALVNYVAGGTGLLGATTVNLIKADTNCEVVTPSTLASLTERTIVIETTEDINNLTFDTSFKTTPGAELNGPSATTTNVNSGSALDTELTALVAEDTKMHLLATLGDWRNIDETPRWADETQSGGSVANSSSEGVSANSLLQLVGVQDAAGNTAAVDHAVGVVFADATPALATSLVNNGSSIEITFDQPLDLTSGTNTFQLISESDLSAGNTGGATYTYTFTLTSATAGTVALDQGFRDQFGEDVAANQALAVTVTTTDNKAFSLAISATTDNNAAGGNPTSFSHYFDYLSHKSTDTAAPDANTATADLDASFYADYPGLRDANYNSWNAVDTYDRYDEVTAGAIASTTPRLVGSDNVGPKLSTEAVGPAAGAPNVFLYAVSAPATITAAHGNRAGAGVALNDNDAVFTAAVGAGTANTDDRALYLEWGFDTTTSTGSVTESQLVIKFSETVTGVGKAYLYFPENEDLSTASANQGDIIVASAPSLNTANAAGAASVDATDTSAIIVGIPDYDAAATRTVRATDRLVLEDVQIGGINYTVHITIPSHAGLTTNTETTGLPTSLTWYRKIQLDDAAPSTVTNDINTGGADFAGLAAGATVNLAAGDLELDLNYREDLQSVSATWTDGADHDTVNTDQIAFPATLTVATDATAAAEREHQAEITLVNPSTETSTKYVGHGATITVDATDFSNASSRAVITLNLAHGIATINDVAGVATGATLPILNTISGNAID